MAHEPAERRKNGIMEGVLLKTVVKPCWLCEESKGPLYVVSPVESTEEHTPFILSNDESALVVETKV